MGLWVGHCCHPSHSSLGGSSLAGGGAVTTLLRWLLSSFVRETQPPVRFFVNMSTRAMSCVKRNCSYVHEHACLFVCVRVCVDD